MTAIALITTRNEAATIGGLVSQIREGLRMPVLVVDDRSTDGTAASASAAGATVIVTPERLGIGPALTLGWRFALAQGFKRLVQLDAGGSHDPGDIPRLLEARADLVIGSRFVPGSRYLGRPGRARMSRLAARACNFARPGVRVHDWTSGFRVFAAPALAALLTPRYYARMHGWQIEVLAQALRLGLSIAEVPITYRAGRSAFSRQIAGEAFSVWLDILFRIPPGTRSRHA